MVNTEGFSVVDETNHNDSVNLEGRRWRKCQPVRGDWWKKHNGMIMCNPHLGNWSPQEEDGDDPKW